MQNLSTFWPESLFHKFEAHFSSSTIGCALKNTTRKLRGARDEHTFYMVESVKIVHPSQ